MKNVASFDFGIEKWMGSLVSFFYPRAGKRVNKHTRRAIGGRRSYIHWYIRLRSLCECVCVSLLSIYLVTSGWRLIRVSGSVLTFADASNVVVVQERAGEVFFVFFILFPSCRCLSRQIQTSRLFGLIVENTHLYRTSGSARKNKSNKKYSKKGVKIKKKSENVPTREMGNKHSTLLWSWQRRKRSKIAQSLRNSR